MGTAGQCGGTPDPNRESHKGLAVRKSALITEPSLHSISITRMTTVYYYGNDFR